MQKLFFGLTFLILLLVGGSYSLLFTNLGNSLVSSIIESKVNEGQKIAHVKINNFKLTMNSIEVNASIDDDSFVNITGALNIFARNFDLNYDIDIKELAYLQNITKQKLNGALLTKGILKGNEKSALLKGKTSLASSDTNYEISFIDFEVDTILFDMKNAKIESLLSLLNQNIYTNGLLSVDARIKDVSKYNPRGKIVTNILKGKLNNEIINKDFNQKLLQKITYNGNVITRIESNKASSIVDLNTDIANINMQKAIFDINKSEFISDYEIVINDLSKLFDITQTKLRGNAKVNGNIKQNSNTLQVNGKSSLFGGNIDFELLNDNLKSNIKDVEIKSLSHMLYYPEFFTSKSNIDIDYNIASKIGKIDGNLINGRFVKNEYSNIISSLVKFDLTKEVYKEVEIKSDINNSTINSVVNMQSKYTKIKVPQSTLQLDKNYIDALIQTSIKEYSFDTTIKGNLSSPKISVDTEALLKSKIGTQIQEKVKDKIKDKLNIDVLKMFMK